MNRRLLLLLLSKADPVGYGVVGYAGVDLAIDNDITAMKVWKWGNEWFDAPTSLVKRGDTLVIKQPGPYRGPEKSVREIINDIDRNRGLTATEVVDRAKLDLDTEERKSRLELTYDMLRAGVIGNPFLMFTSPVQHNKLLLKRKKS